MVTKPVTTDELMVVMQDMMRMTSDRFDQMDERFDRLEARVDRIEIRVGNIETRLGRIELELKAIKAKLLEHDLQLVELRRIAQQLTDKHSAYINDIADILDRITKLERQVPHVSREEIYEIQAMLQKLVDWALKAAKTVKVPLNLP